MKKYIIITFLLVSLKTFSQVRIPVRNGCDFFTNLKFKNGVDTLIIKATYRGLARSDNNGPVFKILEKQGKIKKLKFISQIGYQPESCSKTFWSPISSDNAALLNHSDFGVSMYLTCILFENPEWKYEGMPFLVVINATLKKP